MRPGDDRLRQAPAGWYWCNYPLADETPVLLSLQMKPTDCTDVDVWWCYGVDVALLTVSCYDGPEIYSQGWFGEGRNAYPRLTAKLPVPYITHGRILAAMDRFCELGLTGSRFKSRPPRDRRLRWTISPEALVLSRAKKKSRS